MRAIDLGRCDVECCGLLSSRTNRQKRQTGSRIAEIQSQIIIFFSSSGGEFSNQTIGLVCPSNGKLRVRGPFKQNLGSNC